MKKQICECYERVLEAIRRIPVVDTHEHLVIPSEYTSPREPLALLLRGYFPRDLSSVGIPQNDLKLLLDDKTSTEKKWPIFKRYWVRTEHTAYAREVKDSMLYYGEEKLDLESLQRLSRNMPMLDEKGYIEFLDSLNIRALLINRLSSGPNDLKRFVHGDIKLPECFKLLIPLPTFHGTGAVGETNEHFGKGPWSFQGIQAIADIIDRTVTSLDEFLETVREIMERLKQQGAVGFKDQSAYYRTIDFAPATREEAERLFNKCLGNPNNSLGWPEAKPLDDFLFHEYMRFAAEMEMPVQIHTGYVPSGNVVLFAEVVKLHREVAFDMFHGNWPYMGDLLLLAKFYPNAYLNLCWVHIADPIYSMNMLERAVVTVPHKKIMGFGADYVFPELIPAHLSLAQRNIARALSNLVSEHWLTESEAINMAADWLFNNPNDLYKLGLKPYTP